MNNEFDALWDRYVDMGEDISDQLGLDPIHDGHDKAELRELWEDGNLAFIGGVPIITPTED